MKKLLLAAMLVAPLAMAQGVGVSAGASVNAGMGTSVDAPVGAAAGATVTVATVQDVLLNAKDDQAVVLRGHIVKKISREKYEFTDGTGTIRAEIDKKYFPAGQPIDAQATVEISGEFDKSLMGKPEIDVKSPVRIVQ